MHLFALIEEDREPLSFDEPAAAVYASLPLGVYTALVTFERDRFLELGAHLDRLESSMAELGWAYVLKRRALRKALHELCQVIEPEAPNLRFRLDVLAAAPERWGLAAYGEAGRLLVAVSPFIGWPEAHYQDGVRVATMPALHREKPKAKTADFALAREAAREAAPMAYEYLLIDQQGFILECTSSNFFGVRGGTIWTADRDILEGVTRRIVLEVIETAALPLRKTPLPLAAVPEMEEAFLSSSSRGIMPIVGIDGQVVGAGRPGPITRQLMKEYAAYVKRAIRPAWPPPELEKT